MPPPANIPIDRAFELCGPAPMTFAIALEVSEMDDENLERINAEDSEDHVEHGEIEVLDEDFADDAKSFENAPIGLFEEEAR
ncbi:MAG TPA: hypothetical protein VFI90_07770 [Rubrobacter sp.]|nr:hypothetical protein [Rubrobacter sp.]